MRHPARWAAALAVAASIPALVSGFLAVTGGWAAVIDNAVVAVRTHDVLGGHLPLLGPYTSLTVVADTSTRLYHLGPLESWLFAVPARLGGPSGAGLAAGAALINAAAAGGTVWIGYRIGGLRVAALATAATALMAWSLGGQVLHDPWPQHLALFPFLFLLFACWSIAVGDAWILPLAAFVATFVIQLYLPFLVLAGAVSLWAAAAFAVHLRRQRAALAPEAWIPVRDRARRAALVSGVVVLACWSGPIVDQFFGKGNLTGVVGAGLGGGYDKVGASIAWRDLVHAASITPEWAHPFTGQIKADPVPSAWSTVTALVVLAALIGVTLWAWSRHRGRAATVGTTALVACVGAMFTTMSAPLAYRYTEFIYPRRIWWPVGVFLWVALVEGVMTVVVARRTRPFRNARAAMVVGGLLAVVVAFVATWPRLGAAQDYGSASFDAVRDLGSRVDRSLHGEGPWRVQTRGDFAKNMVGPGLTSELVYRGHTVVVDDANFPDYGDSHIAGPRRPVAGDLLVVSGDGAGQPRPGYRLLAKWDPDMAEHRSYRESLLAVPVGPAAVYVRDDKT